MEFMKTTDVRAEYAFGDEIGSGNFATVYKAKHIEGDTDVAIKCIKKNKIDIGVLTNFVKNECEILFKPENILFTSYEEDAVLKIADFGLARIVGDDVLTTACGTPWYISPEVLIGTSYDFAADFWSLGVIMSLLLTGDVPFKNKSQPHKLMQEIKSGQLYYPNQKWAHVSAGAKDLVRRLLEHDPKKRYGAAQIYSHPWILNDGEGGSMDIEN